MPVTGEKEARQRIVKHEDENTGRKQITEELSHHAGELVFHPKGTGK